MTYTTEEILGATNKARVCLDRHPQDPQLVMWMLPDALVKEADLDDLVYRLKHGTCTRGDVLGVIEYLERYAADLTDVEDMDRCPECGKYVVQHNGDSYYCASCKRWFTLDEVLPREAAADLTDSESGV